MHVAIIMDGNGRWAQRRGLPRTAGHAAGARAVRTVVETAAATTIDMLTLYAFSSDNWRRPATEINGLFGLLRRYIRSEAARCVDNGVRVEFIGRRDRLPPQLAELMTWLESITGGGTRLLLRIAVDYSAREAILAAAAQAASERSSEKPFSSEVFSQLLQQSTALHGCQADVDLLIRTGGERRLSDFLLWEAAYAELFFTDTFWPDFDATALQAALDNFNGRERRYGALPAEPVQAAAENAP